MDTTTTKESADLDPLKAMVEGIPGANRVKILLVDDLKDNLLALEGLLRRNDVEIFKARSGIEALEFMIPHEFALALIDVQMPVMSGFELAELMRGANKTKNIPIIFVTATAKDQNFSFKGYDSGAVDFLLKPLDTFAVKSKANIFIELYLEKKALQKAHKEVEGHLKETANVLLESNQKLQDFTSIASHDLKAPARTTGMYVSLLAREYADKLDERGREFLGFAISESKKMQDIINDLLEYTKVCHSPLEMKPISLNKVIRDTLAILTPEIEERRASVVYEPLPTIHGSESQLRRLFDNLISNAIKFSPSKPKIHISASESTTDYTISVSDNGVGIPQRERELVFEMFHRGHPQSEFPGNGIGLASCKRIIENHQGKLWVTSEEGKGSTFFLSFPIHLDKKMSIPPPNAPKPQKKQEIESLH